MLTDPFYTPACDLSAVVSCATVISTWQASLVGDLPNPALGALGFPMVLVSGALLLAEARPARWFWLTFAAGVVAGVVLIHWLAYQAVFVIGALCPWCMVVWTATMCTSAATASVLAGQRMLPAWVGRWAPSAVIAWAGALAVIIGVRFADQWSALP